MAKIPEVVTVKVTQKQIDKSKEKYDVKNSPLTGCPVWRALQKLCKAHNVNVFVSNTKITFYRYGSNGRKYVAYKIDLVGREFITDFTNWKTRNRVRPAEFTIRRDKKWKR